MNESPELQSRKYYIRLWRRDTRFVLVPPDAPPQTLNTSTEVQRAIRSIIKRLKPIAVGAWEKGGRFGRSNIWRRPLWLPVIVGAHSSEVI